jgi:hypothetical protein
MIKGAYLVMDIGGTKIRYAVFSVDSAELIFQHRIALKKGKINLRKQVAKIVQRAKLESEKLGWKLSSKIAVASPGKLIGQKRHIVAKDSMPNLECYKDEFAGLNLHDYLLSGLTSINTLGLINDALAQMAGGVGQLFGNYKEYFAKQKIAYIGPGTGLGGGFANVDDKGNLDFKTDGHISDIKFINDQGKMIKIEDELSGLAFYKKQHIIPEKVNNNAKMWLKYSPDVEKLGCILARLIQQIYLGEFEKINAHNNWPAEDLEYVKGIKTYVIGGSFGSKGKIAQKMKEVAERELIKQGLSKIKLFLIPNCDMAPIQGLQKIFFKEKIC